MIRWQLNNGTNQGKTSSTENSSVILWKLKRQIENWEMRKEGKRRQKRKEDKKRVVVSNLPFERWSHKENPNRHYCGNQIKTSKYTVLSFIPKNIFEQLHRFANLYFVGIVILNFVPVVNAFQPEMSTIPVCVILAVTAIKDAWEDLRRYKSDKLINNSECFVYNR